MTPIVPTTPLARASIIPKRYYLDPAILEAEKERVFGRTWQLVARTDELQRIGDFVPATVLDEPVVITHGLDGELRAFYNVCRHRAGQVALTRGNRKSLQCRYHGWTYGLDGALRACPEMEETEDLPRAHRRLIGHIHTHPMTYEELLALARRFEGQTLETVTGKKFTVGIYLECPFFTPASSGRGQSDGRKAAERFLERYNEIGSLRPGEYSGVTRNASYYVGLIQRA
jgi:nitrite reductase/ring-hydroxylating ferredoxin subunit